MLAALVLAVYRTVQLPVPAESLGLWSANHSLVFDLVSSVWEVGEMSALVAPSVVAVRVLVVYRAVRVRGRFLSLGLRMLFLKTSLLPQNSL